MGMSSGPGRVWVFTNGKPGQRSTENRTDLGRVPPKVETVTRQGRMEMGITKPTAWRVTTRCRRETHWARL